MIDRRALMAAAPAALAASALAVPPAMAVEPAQLKGMIFGKGPEGHFDDKAFGMSVPYWSPERRQWMLWYFGRDKAWGAEPESLTTGRIGLATSADGIQWQRFNGPGFGGSILEPSQDPADFDSFHIGLLDVKYLQGGYWMWYFGGDRTPSKDDTGHATIGYGMRPGLARSPDGVKWTKVRGPGPGGSLFDYERIYACWESVVHDGEKFIMYYSDVDPSFERIGTRYAHSRDGLTWTQMGEITWTDGPRIFDKQGIVMRHVQANPLRAGGGRWLMIYAAVGGDPAHFKQRTVAAAVSDDGANWRHLYDEPILRPTAEPQWDSRGVSGPRLVAKGDELRLYYYGYSNLTYPRNDTRGKVSPLPAGLGLAISTTGDLRDLARI